MSEATRDEVRGLWDRHIAREFPASLRSEEVAGVDLVLLDAGVAGWVASWLGSSSELDTASIQMLREALTELEAALVVLDEPSGGEYFTALRDVIVEMLGAQRRDPTSRCQ